MSIALSSLIDQTREDETLLPQILSSFSCYQDVDIERFLYDKAIKFENLNKAKTYIIYDEDQVNRPDFCLDQLTIYGYITLSLKILTVPPETSGNKRKNIDGFSSRLHGKPISDFPCYLIGQLAKNSNIEDNKLTGNELLRFAYEVIASAVDAVGGRYMMIECHNNPKLIEFYARNGFDEIAREPDGEFEMVQMIRKI